MLVDDADFDELSKVSWFVSRHGYARRNYYVRLPVGKRVNEEMHRKIVGLVKGDKRQVDHLNGNRLDNRRCNLRICTHAQNMRNKGAHPSNTSGFKGVSYLKRSGKWKAVIYSDKKQKHLGTFETPELAHEAYKRAAIQLHGEFANYGD